MNLKLLLLAGFAFTVAPTEIKQVGDAIILHPDKSMEPLSNFLWEYSPAMRQKNTVITNVTNGKVIQTNGTRFEGRLHTDAKTGSITISKLTLNDGGIFSIQIFIGSENHTGSVHLIVTNDYIIRDVLEGGNVTLETQMEKLEMKHTVKWTKIQDGERKLVAHWKNSNLTIEKSFKDVLWLNPKNGYLTFIRVTEGYSGLYNVEILEGKEHRSEILFNMTVYEPVSVPFITKGGSPADKRCYVICSVENGLGVNLTWYNGPKKISSVSNFTNISMNLSLPLWIQPKKNDNYTCEARNPASAERTSLNLIEWLPAPQPGSTHTTVVIVVLVLAILLLAGVIIFFIDFQKRRNPDTETGEFKMNCLRRKYNSLSEADSQS
ncbi:CD48 antigen isoform X2 [Fundulus heteroclitus]|nr:CD48 antigen isoform X2 [Fundulus heteroclitus]